MKTVVKPNPENADTKKKQVTEMFDGISKSYDALNRIITLGIDVLWRKRVVAIVQKESPKTILDIATGTADLAVALASIQPERIVGLDISPGMLALGKDKIKRLKLEDSIEMQLGDSEALPFPNSSFDAVTVSFGVRNFEHLEKGLQEIERVLKPKGKLVILETAVPKNKFISLFYSLYTQNIMPFLGKLFAKNKGAYQYLSTSAMAFPSGEKFNNILRETGFIEVEDIPQTLGVASIYVAKKA